MDPDESLRLLLTAVVQRDGEALREHAENLADWLEHNGFAPSFARVFAMMQLKTRDLEAEAQQNQLLVGRMLEEED